MIAQNMTRRALTVRIEALEPTGERTEIEETILPKTAAASWLPVPRTLKEAAQVFNLSGLVLSASLQFEGGAFISLE